MTVTVMSKPGCVQCNATYRSLDKKGVSYTVEDAAEKPEILEKALALGYMQAPVIFVEADGELVDHWSGFNPGKIEELVEQKAA